MDLLTENGATKVQDLGQRQVNYHRALLQTDVIELIAESCNKHRPLISVHLKPQQEEHSQREPNQHVWNEQASGGRLNQDLPALYICTSRRNMND